MEKRHTKILIEQDEVVVWRRAAKPIVAWCQQCQQETQKVAPKQAALLCQVDPNRIQEWIQSGALHASETAGHGLLICTNCADMCWNHAERERKRMRNTSAKNLNWCMSAVTLIAPFVLCLAISQSVIAQTSYTITDIGPLNDLNDQAPGATCVNNAGMVVGQAILPAGPDRPFLWIKGHVFDLGTFGGLKGGARGINARGEVVGKADTTVHDQEHAFLWSDGMLHDLGTLGGDSSTANSINNLGWIAGAADTTIPDPTHTIGLTENHAFLRTSGSALHDLGTLGGPNSHAISINTNGVIVGWSQVDFSIGAFGIPDLHPTMWVNGVPTLLPDLGGSVSLAVSVNDRGTAVGQSFLADDSAFYAVMWHKGELRNLGAVGDDVASAAGSINNWGDVTGVSFPANGPPRAFLWRKGVMTDLNTLIPANSGWGLQSAGINDAGLIVGYGTLNGNLHAFLLTPRPSDERASSATASPAPVQHSEAMRRSLIWGKSGLLKHGSVR